MSHKGEVEGVSKVRQKSLNDALGRFHQRFLRTFFHSNVFFSSYVLVCMRKTRAKNVGEIDPLFLIQGELRRTTGIIRIIRF